MPSPKEPVAAVVSDITDKRIRPERKNLAAHNAVVKRLMEDTTILPVAFGTIADSPQAVREILSDHRDAFVEQLEPGARESRDGAACRLGCAEYL